MAVGKRSGEKALQKVLGQGANVNGTNPLEVHDPKVGSLISYEGETTADGAADGSTLIDSGLATKPDFNGNLVIITSGAYAGQARDNIGVTTGGTVTPHLVFDGQILRGTTFVIAALRLTPAEVAALTLMVATNQYFDKIFFDEDTGIAGTAWPVGTPQVPSDVFADIVTMCVARNIRIIHVAGSLALGAAMNHYSFIGPEHLDPTDQIDLNAQDVDGSYIESIMVTGEQGGSGFLVIRKATINGLTEFYGLMNECDFYGNVGLADDCFADINGCQSIYGLTTITVQAPNRASIKDWKGNLTLTLQDGGVMLVRGFKGTLVIDEMTDGTLDIYANGADITINANCSGGTINIYGNARVDDNSGATVVTDYTKETQLDDIQESQARQLFPLDFWSDPVKEKVVTDAQVTAAVGAAVEVAGLPDGATVVIAKVMFKYRMVENTNVALNSLDLAAIQPIQVNDSGDTGWLTCINFVDEEFEIAAEISEGGDVLIGKVNVATRVDGNDTYDFQWLNAKAHLADIKFRGIQMGLRIWYSV